MARGGYLDQCAEALLNYILNSNSNYSNHDVSGGTVYVRRDNITDLGLLQCIDSLLRRGQCVAKDLARSSRRYPVYAVNLNCLKEFISGGAARVDKAEVDWGAVARKLDEYVVESMQYVFSVVKNALMQNVPVALVGPPGSGKTYVLSLLKDLVPGAVWLYGPSLTSAGLEDLLMEYVPPLLLVDELDKAKDAGHLLSLAESDKRRLVITKSGKNADIDASGMRIVVAYNPNNRKSSVTWDALCDRFVTLEVPRLRKDEVLKVVRRYVPDAPDWIADLYDRYELSVRQAINIAKLERDKDMAEKLAIIMAKYSKRRLIRPIPP